MTIDYKKILMWVLIGLFCFSVSIIIAWQFKGCFSGCNMNEEEITTETAKRDNSKELLIGSLYVEIDSLKQSNEILSESLRLAEQERNEIIIKSKVKNAQAELRQAPALYKEARFWLSGSRPLELKPRFEFDSLDVLSLVKKKIEYDFLYNDRDLLEKEKLIFAEQIKNYKWQVSDLNKIIQHKDEQLTGLENIPRVTYKKSSRKFTTDIITHSVAFGLGVLARSLIK